MRMRWPRHIAQIREKRNPFMIFVGKPEGKSPLGRPRYRWMDNIKIDLRETGWDDMDWSDLAQDRDRWRALEQVNELSDSLKCCELLKYLHSWRLLKKGSAP
jgi:hypothetical protein